MSTSLIIATSLFCLVGGVIATRIWYQRNMHKLIRARVSELHLESLPASKLFKSLPSDRADGNNPPQWQRNLQEEINLLGWNVSTADFFLLTAILFMTPTVVAALMDWSVVIASIAGMIVAVIPIVLLKLKAKQQKTKFLNQLPDAIDLMISILKSGHSVPQAVKAISTEMAAPCGPEFASILQRVELGQSLVLAIAPTIERYQSFEMDLLARALAIQLEVGGSLAELLEKTNQTLRQRLKLKRQVTVLTAQSRLTAIIVGFMPFLIGGAFSFINPSYMEPLLNTNMGRALLGLAFALQIMGILVMRRLSAFKV